MQGIHGNVSQNKDFFLDEREITLFWLKEMLRFESGIRAFFLKEMIYKPGLVEPEQVEVKKAIPRERTF
jgi:hypothetical protein